MYSTSDEVSIVSLYATWGAPTLASTLNSLFILSTMISRCSSPIPFIIVCPDSSSDVTLNEGSSFANLPNASPIFSWSALVFGSTAISMTGSGNSIGSKRTPFSLSHNVCPVIVFLRPASATISPALASFISSLELACINSILPTLSSFSFDELYTAVPVLIVPE